MSEPTQFCYSCLIHHPESVMRQVHTMSSGKRWQCIKSINAIKKKDAALRDEFGKKHSKANLLWSPDKPRLKI